MMDSLAERIEIIDSFAVIHAGRNKSIEKRRRDNSMLFYLYGLLALVFMGIVLWSIIIELTGFPSKFNWNKAGIAVLFSISTLFNTLKGVYSYLLLNHLKFLESSTSKRFDENLNTALAKIIATHNKPMGENLFTTFLAIVILIGAITNFFMDSQFIYYKFFIAPTLLFYVLAILEGLKTYKKLKVNIEDVEGREKQVGFNLN